MSMTVGSNAASLVAQRSLHESSRDMSTAMERLSTGSKINSASDDAAGLAIASRMTGQINGLEAAEKNIIDGMALTATLEGSLEEVDDILQRMRTLATQAASDTVSAKDRNIMNNEMTALKNELTAMSTRAQYNGQAILDGSYTGKLIQVGDTANETISVTQASIAADSIGAFTLAGDTIAVQVDTTADRALSQGRGSAARSFTITPSGGTATAAIADAAADSAKTAAAEVNALTGTTGVSATAITEVQIVFSANAQNIKINGVDVTSFAIGDNGTIVNAINAFTSQTGVVATDLGSARTILLTDADGDDITLQNQDATATLTMESRNAAGTLAAAVTLQNTGHNGGNGGGADAFAHISGHITLTSDKTFSVAETGASYVGSGSVANNFVSTASLATQSGANTAISTISGAIATVAGMRADLGALTNRMEHALDSTLSMRDSLEVSRSKLVDADMAKESANLAKAQVLQQVGTAMLAQANAQPQLVLQLLQ